MLDNISRILMILPPIVAVLRWGYLDTPIKVFSFLIIFNFFVSASSHILGTIFRINTFFLTYINVLGSLTIFIIFFQKSILNKYINATWIFILPLLIYIIYEIKTKNVLFSTGLFIYHDIIVVIFSTVLLIKIFNSKISELRRYTLFWVCCNTLFFYNYDLILAFLSSNLFDYLDSFFELIFYGIAPLFNITFTLLNAYIFYKTKDWSKNLLRK